MPKRKPAASTSPDLSGIAPALRPLAIPLADCLPDPQNARIHDDDSIAAVMASLRQFQQQKPIVVQASSRIIRAGNGTWEAARRLGWTHIAANVAELTDEQARGFALFDNRSAELSDWNAEEVEKLLAEIPLGDELLASLGQDLLQELNELADDAAACLESAPAPAGDDGITLTAVERDPREPSSDDPPRSTGPVEPAERKYRVLVECRDEMHQQEVLNALDEQGLKCRSLIA